MLVISYPSCVPLYRHWAALMGRETGLESESRAVTQQGMQPHGTCAGEQGWDKDDDWGQMGAHWCPGKSTVTRQAWGQAGNWSLASTQNQPRPSMLGMQLRQRSGRSVWAHIQLPGKVGRHRWVFFQPLLPCFSPHNPFLPYQRRPGEPQLNPGVGGLKNPSTLAAFTGTFCGNHKLLTGNEYVL